MRIEYLIYEVFQSYRNDFGSQFVLCHTLLFTSLRSKKSMHSSSEVEERFSLVSLRQQSDFLQGTVKKFRWYRLIKNFL